VTQILILTGILGIPQHDFDSLIVACCHKVSGSVSSTFDAKTFNYLVAWVQQPYRLHRPGLLYRFGEGWSLYFLATHPIVIPQTVAIVSLINLVAPCSSCGICVTV